MRKTLTWLEAHFEELLCSMCMAIMICAIFGQVVMRYVFSAPVVWAEEVAIYSFVWFLYLAAAFAVRERAHIRMLSGILILPRRLRNVVLIASDIVWIALTTVLFVLGLEIVSSMSSRAFYSPALGLHQKWTYMILPVGFGLMLARLAQVYWLWASTGRPPFDEMRGATE